MTSNLQPSSSNSTPPPMPLDSTNSVSGSSGQTKTMIVNGKVVIVDTTSSAAGGAGTAPNKTDASRPQLFLDSNQMTSAQMYAMGMTVMDQAHKQRILTDEANAKQYQLTLALKIALVTTDPGTTTPIIPGTGTPTTPTTSTTPIKQPPTIHGVTSGTVVASQSTSTQQTSNTSPIIGPIQSFQTVTGVEMSLESTLADAVLLSARKQFTIANPLAPPPEQAAFESSVKSFIDSYIRSLIAAGNVQSLGPSELFLKIPGIKALNLDSSTVGAATAVSFSEYVMGLVKSGDLNKFADTYIFPNNPAAAKAFAADVGSILLDISLEQVGTALNLPNLTQQVEAQAKLVRDTNNLLTNPLTAQEIIQKAAANQAQISGLDQADLEAKALSALTNTMTAAPYLTQQDLSTALQANLAAEFPNQEELSHQLANQIISSGIQLALGNQLPYALPSVNPGDINITSLQSSIIDTMERDFIKSDRDIRQAKKDDDAAKAIIADVVNKQYNNELAVRSDIQSQLLDKIPDITPEQAADIAANANLGIQHTGPLYTRGDSTVLSPLTFSQDVQIGYQANVHASPELEFGQAIDHVAGLSTGYDGTNMIALINQNYYQSGTESRSYLNLPAAEQVKVQQQRLFDPGAQLVLAWGSIINGVTGPKPNNIQGNSIPI